MHILISGANRGIGLGLVRVFIERGDTVVATAREPRGAQELQALQAQYAAQLQVLPLDVDDDASCAALAGQLTAGSLDGLINNAGRAGGGDALESLDFAVGEAVLRTNACGPLRVTRALAAALRRPGAKVLNVSSRMGSIADNQQGGSMFYRMSKAALNMATRTLALQWQPEGITVWAMHPGWVQTRMGGRAAPTAVATSATALAQFFVEATPAVAGGFFNLDGQPLPY